MLLDFSNIHKQYNTIKPIRGVIHVGAHHGEESVEYRTLGINDVVWFEALPKTFVQLQRNVGGLQSNLLFNVALSDADGYSKFYVTDNGRGNNCSSSMLELGKHVKHHPHVKVKEVINVETTRFDTLATKQRLDMTKYNLMNVDVQGAELRVIKGMGTLIDGFDYVIAEVNEAELYKGCALLDELNEYLTNHGFVMKQKVITKYEWGDALFVRE